MKTPESMQRLEELFHEAVSLEPRERADFMARLRDTDPELVAAVESLIAAHEGPDSMLDVPAYEAAAELIAEAQPALEAGQVVGHFWIIALLGKGGMGEVYLASDKQLDRKVALKLLPAGLTDNKDRLRRFIQEAKAASSLNHPNIITIHEIGQTEGAHFIATEFIDGHTLRHELMDTRMELPDILDVSIQAAGALNAAHDAGIVHRDIKPENIMLRPDGYVKILDFGLAKLTEKPSQMNPTDSAIDTRVTAYTRPGAVMGTVNYMSPEQARGLNVDARTDVFSLGVVMYEMAAGRMAFARETAMDTLVSILEKEPPPLEHFAPNVPAEFQRIIGKALRKDREERYQTIRDLLSDLKSLREELAFVYKLERSKPPHTDLEAAVASAATEAAATTRQEASVGLEAATAARSVQTKADRGRRTVTVALAFAVLAGFAVVVGILWARRGASPVIQSAPATAAERAVSYWITVQKYRGGKAYQEPFRLRDDINFEKDYRIRLHITSAQSGRLYMLNEGPPAGAEQTPTFNVLFPSATANNGSALLRENQQIQIPEQSWFQFDAQQGTEKIWLVWAERDVPELEAVKGFANPTDRGVVSSPGLRAAVNEFLRAYTTPSVTVARDEEKKATLVRANGAILVHVIKLEHH